MLTCLFLVLEKLYCIHDQVQKPVNKRLPLDDEYYPIGERNPVRVKFDFYNMIQGNDTKMCKIPGQIIVWNGASYKCTQGDILKKNTLQKVQKIINNIETLLQDHINVTTLKKPIKVHSILDIDIPDKEEEQDLVVLVVARPFGDVGAIASAFFDDMSDTDNRPILGGIHLNIKIIEQTSEMEVQNIILHELFHVLGISFAAYQYWINPDTRRPYTDHQPVKILKLPEYPNKDIVVETGPYAHAYASERYGSEEFLPGIQASIILEDGGGSGTKYSHVKGSVYAYDFFLGVNLRPSVVSGVAAALLKDTGWYDVDDSFTKPLPWGDYRSLGLPPRANLSISPPQLALPKSYRCSRNEERCSYDYASCVRCSTLTSIDCSNPSNANHPVCLEPAFFNPLDLTLLGPTDLFDYFPLPTSITRRQCEDPENSIKGFGEYFGAGSMCAMSSISYGISSDAQHARCYRMGCDANGTLSVYVDRQRKECSAAGERLSFFGYSGSIICPDPVAICRMRRYKGMADEDPEDLKWSYFDYDWVLIATILAALIFLAIVGLIILSCYVRRRKRKSRMPSELQRTLITSGDSSYDIPTIV